MICPVCNITMPQTLLSFHYECKKCGYEGSTLDVSINLKNIHQLLNEKIREVGLKELRVFNFKIIKKVLTKFKSKGALLLDVGCAHGWFIESTKDYFNSSGIEPDKEMFNYASKNKLNVRQGYFPDALDTEEKFDVISFNDVLEHIPNIENLVDNIYRHLNKKGIVSINLPNNKGVFYKVAKILCRLGIPSFFNRLWQKDLPLPHIHYFNFDSLITFLQKKDFSIKHRSTLKTIHLKGLYQRIKYSNNKGFLFNVIVYIFVLGLYPLLILLPKDIIFIVAEKNN